jgi:hypothetical protein
VCVAVEEIISRILCSYIAIASLRRPFNESSRLLTASEMSALDMLFTNTLTQYSLHANEQKEENVVLAEFK